MTEREFLKSVPLFSRLGEASLDSILRLTRRKRFKKDEVIFHEKEAGDTLYIILHGRVKVAIFGDDGKEVTLSILTDGDFFGEMSLLDSEPRSATTIAEIECDLLSLHRDDFMRALDHDPGMSASLIEILANRLRKANQQISTLALLDVYGRVARVIQELAEEEGKRLKDGRVVVRRPTHIDIAHRIGSSRETVTRMMRDLEQNGHIETQGREIFLRPDFQKLF
ncbi:MAG: Crp/Fnr family transcriptional regulator [Vicinamibacteria bacterium]